MEGFTAFSIRQLKRPLAVFLFAFVIPGWVLSAMPGLESTLLVMPGAHLAAFLTGTPLQYLEGNWCLFPSGQVVAITTACSGSGFFLILSLVLAYQSRHWIRSLPVIIGSSLALSLLTTLIVNSVRITLVIRMHPWITPVLPDEYNDISHLLLGVIVFLPALIAIHYTLDRHGTTIENFFRKQRA